GDTLVVVYQKDRTSGTPYLYSTMSTDYGVNWSTPQMQSSDGEHPDIAYGQAGNVYLTYHKTIKDDIAFLRGKTYETGPWDYVEYLTTDSTSCHDDFPKIAALHTLPADTTTVWVAYNHDEAPPSKVMNTDLRFAYSTNSGVDWTKDQVLANDPSADEMAADLKVYRSSTNKYVDLCYLKYSGVVKSGSDIYYTWANATHPEQFYSPHQIINEHWANCSPDGRENCQLTYPIPDDYPGIVYAGFPLKKDDGKNLDFGGWDLYYDFHDWTDVEEETAEEKLPAEFSLSNNYPNPFNPETKIGYFIPKACQVNLEVFNILGQRVRTLIDEVQTKGKKEVTWDGKGESGNEVASGVYFYKLETENFSQTKKMVLMK
ncbi:MAG: T9SS type A sorting domain-containing protein, partial [candidate division Zixibacteria bacterium]|nr:T9SS type A sorting domain-containing protein [candidate division Zixibacteria bacterium]